MDRREQIADAGIYVIAHRGVRALTHRSVDELLGLAAGSTSYYARTRRDLLGLIISRLAEPVEVPSATVPETLSPAGAAEFLSTVMDRLASSPERYLARVALLLECRADEPLHAALSKPAAGSELAHLASELLQAIDAVDVAAHAADLLALVESLLMQRLILGARLDERRVLRSYLAALCA